MFYKHRSTSADWPDIDYAAGAPTATTLHLWTQVAGKIRLRLAPWVNHSWHVPLYLSARGMRTGPMPYGARTLELAFDFIDHDLRVLTGDGKERRVELRPRTVADFHAAVMAALGELDIAVEINTTPSELADAVPFEQDEANAGYDPAYAARLWRALLQIDRVFKEFRARFIGKVSPVHFFWGSFDLAVTRFSGREAPEHPGGVPNFPDWVAREAYSHEVSSAGFWPGAGIGYPAFYCYAYPGPDGFAEAPV
ncbi:MAG: DUF5996 family protein, partial [Pseudomonadota bacterium]